ncbi:MAG: DUF6798 domain-containing protein [Pseudomonadota bacterium]
MTPAATVLETGKPASLGSLALFLLLGAWFFLVFPTESLYYENQNTKFLHGMAAAGIGHLDQDWTADTIDVMPVFTGIVYALHVLTPAFVCYLVQIALFAVFLYAVVHLAVFALGEAADRPWFKIIVGALVVASQFSNGGARVWGGVAKQYLLGPALEPQSFGVLFLLAVVLFMRRRTEPALLLTTVPAIIHPGYVVPAGTLILAFLLAAWLSPDRSRRPRLLIAMVTLVAAATSMGYLGLMILPTDAESWRQANEILAKVRIPGHAVPAYWFDIDAAAKIAGCALALWLVRKRSPDLFWIIAFCFGTALGLTLLTVALDSAELGMISPWRISVYLVPLGLAVLLAHAVAAGLDLPRRGGGASVLCKGLGVLLALLVLGVTVRGALEKVELYQPAATPDHVSYMRQTGDARTLYLSNPRDMDIRLESGLPQLVSWKTHPYKDVEVLEWHRRYQLARRVFQGDRVDCTALDEVVRRYGTTHLLLEDTARTLDCTGATPVFEGEAARIYRLAR